MTILRLSILVIWIDVGVKPWGSDAGPVGYRAFSRGWGGVLPWGRRWPALWPALC